MSTQSIKPYLLTLATCCLFAAGCSNGVHESPTSATQWTTRERAVLNETASTRAVFATTMQQPDVQVGIAMLEAEGYRWADTNSILWIEEHWQSDPAEITPSRRLPGGRETDRRLVDADTLMWLAFETHTVDMTNHTALLAARDESGQFRTMLIEMNIGVSPPTPIRQGFIRDETYSGIDPSTNGLWACFAAGVAASAGGCIVTNCGWAHCTAGGAAASAIGCGLAALFGAI